MGVAGDGEIGEILERLRTSIGAERACERVPAQNLRDFDIEQMRRMQCLALGKKALSDAASDRGAEQHLEQRGRVDDNQRPSRSARRPWQAKVSGAPWRDGSGDRATPRSSGVPQGLGSRV